MNEFADTYYQRASHLSDIGRWREAIKEAGMCIAIEPSHYRALCTISRAYYELEDLPKALEFAGKAIAADPTQEWAHRLQSAVYQKKNKKKKQLETAVEAIKQEPESVLALQNLAYAQLGARKFKEARQTAEKLRRLSPDSAATHKTFGYVEFNDSKFVEAEENFRRALKIDATNYDSLNMLGETLIKRYEKTGSYKTKRVLLNEAIDCFRQAIVLNPTFPEAKSNLRSTHFKSFASTPFSILPLTLNVLLLFLLIINRDSSRDIRPEIFNLDNKSPELIVLYVISWLSMLIALYGLAGIYATKNISESNKKFIDIVDKPTITAKLALGFWLLVSIYPLIWLIWTLVSLNFETFVLLNIMDWITLSAGILAMVLNCVMILPYLFERKSG